MVVDEVFPSLFLTKLFQRIGPENIAHQTMSGGFAETINLSGLAPCPTLARSSTHGLDVFQCMQLRAQTSVYTQKLFVHDCGERQRAESIHTCIVDLLGVFVLAFKLEGEIIGKMSALVVSTKKPEAVGVPDLERPKVQHALRVC